MKSNHEYVWAILDEIGGCARLKHSRASALQYAKIYGYYQILKVHYHKIKSCANAYHSLLMEDLCQGNMKASKSTRKRKPK